MRTEARRYTVPNPLTYGRSGARGASVRLAICCVLFLSTSLALGEAKVNPLEPPDRSSPRATLKTFLESVDGIGDFAAREYRASPSRAGFEHLMELSQVSLGCLDLSEIAPVVRFKAGSAAALALYDTLCKVDLPPLDQVPGKDELKQLTGEPPRWTIPHTGITLTRLASGPRAGDFVFSAHTVENAEDYYTRTHSLPYLRPVPMSDLYQMTVLGGGWLIPFTAVEAMPDWLRHPFAGQAMWKWICMAALLVLFLLFLQMAHLISRRIGEDRPLLRSVARLALPVYLVVAAPLLGYLALVHINARGHVGVVIQLFASGLTFLAGAWLVWRVMDVVAEGLISSPKIKPRSIDAHLTRIFARLLGIAGAVVLLVNGADNVGIPVYGIIAGLGVGGLAIALSAQPTIENLIGGLNIFADRPIRVGQLCKYGTDIGTVEEIGIRSTRIRGADRTLTTVPNGMLSKMSIVNMTERERMLIRAVVSLPGDARDRVRYVLATVQKMLVDDPRIHADMARVRLTSYTGNSVEVEVFAYAMTRDTEEFLVVQQDVLLRTMDILEESKSIAARAAETISSDGDGVRRPNGAQALSPG